MSWKIQDQVNGNVKYFGSAAAYRNTIQAKLASGQPLDNPAAAQAFAPDLFSRTNTPIPTGSPVEKRGDYSSSGSSSEDNGGKSNTTQPAQSQVDTNVGLIKGAPSGIEAGKTINGLTLVTGNLLDTLTSWGNFIFSFVAQYAKPLIYIAALIAFSKVFSWKKK